MKYLKRFNESSSDFTNIISECKDILIELSDKDFKYLSIRAIEIALDR